MKKKQVKPARGRCIWLRKLFMIMKLTFFFILISAMLVSAVGYSQSTRLNLDYKKISVGQLLQLIEDQTDFRFAYSKSGLNTKEEVTIDVKDATLDQVLKIILDNDQLTYSIIDRYVVISDKSFSIQANQQQSKTISGKVTDLSGTSLPGVTIVVKGTTIGIITDADGKYSLSGVPDDAILVFSFVGMRTQEVPVGGKTNINVSMVEETIGIEEVVAIGYGTIKKQNLTNSISKINSESIDHRPIPTLSEAFAGQIAGVRAQNETGIPGAELKIRIRGVNTINGGGYPLYVVDGVTKDNMKDINPNDIASIQVLKDASASAIYGARGGNGVVLIETKQGTGKPTFNFESYYGLQSASKEMDMMNTNEWIAYNIWWRNVAWLRQGGSMSDPMSVRPANYQIPNIWYDYINKEGVDWQDAILVTAPIQSYQLSASAKSDIGSIYISGGLLDQKGIVYDSYYKRMNFRFNGVLNVSKRIKIGMNVAPSFSNQEQAGSEGKELSIHQALMQSPLVPINSATGEWGYPDIGVYVYPNPKERLKETTDNTKLSTVSISTWGQFEIIKGLIFKSQYSYDLHSSVSEYFQPGNVTDNNGNVSIGRSNSSTQNDWSVQNTLTYDKTFKNHSLNILLGQSAEEHKYFYMDAEATGWQNDNVRTLNVAPTPVKASTNKTRYLGASFFGRANYNYNDKYLLNASLRYDGSSRFGRNNKWGLFPSVSAGWKINKESFFGDVGWIDLLKLRISWGKAGNDRIGNFEYMALLKQDNTSWGNDLAGGWAPSNIENPDLKWESTETTDIGIDFTAFNNRVNINLDYYRNTTKDLFFNVSTPYTTGFTSYKSNVGAVRNTGWEIDLTTRNLTGAFKWNTSLNLSKEKNEVLDMGELTQFTSSIWTGINFITRVGGPISQFYIYETDGILTTSDFDNNGSALVPILSGQEPGNVRYVDQNDDGKINSQDYMPSGSNIPDLIYGITNSFEWKNFELSILLQGQIGGKVCFEAQRQLDDGGSKQESNQFSRWLHCWKPDYEAIYGAGENPYPNVDIDGVDFSWDGKTYYPFGVKNNNSDFRIYDTTFLRVKNITLAYTLPKKVLNSTILKSAMFYLSGDNLLTFDNYPGYNPETNSFGNSTTTVGVDYATYPLAKKYTLGVKITF